MNIEESIKEMKSLSPSEEAIETLLTAYEKEKEKNKEQYKEFIKEHGEVCEKLKEDINKEWEDKIKAKIEYNKVFNDNIHKYTTLTLEELLKEE